MAAVRGGSSGLRMVSAVMLVLASLAVASSKQPEAVQQGPISATVQAAALSLSRSDWSDLARMARRHGSYMKEDATTGAVSVNATALLADGYSAASVQYLSAFYSERAAAAAGAAGSGSSAAAGNASAVAAQGQQVTTAAVTPQGVITGVVAKQVIKYVAKNGDTIKSKMDGRLGNSTSNFIWKYSGTGLLVKGLTRYQNLKESVHSWLTRSVSSALPSWMDWATPAVVVAVEAAVPGLRK